MHLLEDMLDKLISTLFRVKLDHKPTNVLKIRGTTNGMLPPEMYLEYLNDLTRAQKLREKINK